MKHSILSPLNTKMLEIKGDVKGGPSEELALLRKCSETSSDHWKPLLFIYRTNSLESINVSWYWQCKMRNQLTDRKSCREVQRNMREKTNVSINNKENRPHVWAITSYRSDLQSPPKLPTHTSATRYRNYLKPRPKYLNTSYCTSACFSYKCHSRVFKILSSSRWRS